MLQAKFIADKTGILPACVMKMLLVLMFQTTHFSIGHGLDVKKIQDPVFE